MPAARTDLRFIFSFLFCAKSLFFVSSIMLDAMISPLLRVFRELLKQCRIFFKCRAPKVVLNRARCAPANRFSHPINHSARGNFQVRISHPCFKFWKEIFKALRRWVTQDDKKIKQINKIKRNAIDEPHVFFCLSILSKEVIVNLSEANFTRWLIGCAICPRRLNLINRWEKSEKTRRIR